MIPRDVLHSLRLTNGYCRASCHMTWSHCLTIPIIVNLIIEKPLWKTTTK